MFYEGKEPRDLFPQKFIFFNIRCTSSRNISLSQKGISIFAVKVKWHTLLKIFWNVILCSQKFTDVSEEYIASIFMRVLLATCFLLVNCLAYSLTLKMEVSVFLQNVGKLLTTWHHILEDNILRSHCCGNLRSNHS
jgi:hypothetical protein